MYTDVQIHPCTSACLYNILEFMEHACRFHISIEACIYNLPLCAYLGKPASDIAEKLNCQPLFPGSRKQT